MRGVNVFDEDIRGLRIFFNEKNKKTQKFVIKRTKRRVNTKRRND